MGTGIRRREQAEPAVPGAPLLRSVRTGRQALYKLAAQRLKEMIYTGQWGAGTRLPSEADLARELGVSRVTLREALRSLEEEQLIERAQGVGTFVRSRPSIRSGIEQLYSVTDMIRREGLVPGTLDLAVEVAEATWDEAEKLGLLGGGAGAGGPQDGPGPRSSDGEGAACARSAPRPHLPLICRMKRVRTANGEPVVYCIDRLPAGRVDPEALRQLQGSLFTFLEGAGIRVAYAISQISPVSHHRVASQQLRAARGEALLLLEQVHFDQHDQPVLYSSNFFRPDRFRFFVLRRRA